jgi:hypothetical protein
MGDEPRIDPFPIYPPLKPYQWTVSRNRALSAFERVKLGRLDV